MAGWLAGYPCIRTCIIFDMLNWNTLLKGLLFHIINHHVTFSLAKNLRCSLTVSLSKRTLCWGHIPRLLRIRAMSSTTLNPLIWADPLVGGKSPVNIDMVVVLPAPLWPNSAVIWPLYMLSVRLSTAIFLLRGFWRRHEKLQCKVFSFNQCWAKNY